MTAMTAMTAMILLLLSMAGCEASTDNNTDTNSSGSDTPPQTTTTKPVLSASEVEGYFAAKRDRKANRISTNNVTVNVVSTDCTLLDPEAGKARCIEVVRYQSIYETQKDTFVWIVRYDPTGGDILAYRQDK